MESAEVNINDRKIANRTICHCVNGKGLSSNQLQNSIYFFFLVTILSKVPGAYANFKVSAAAASRSCSLFCASSEIV